MTLAELKKYVNGLPNKFDEFDVFNGHFKSTEEGDLFRIDEPTQMVVVDIHNNGILFLTEDIDDK